MGGAIGGERAAILTRTGPAEGLITVLAAGTGAELTAVRVPLAPRAALAGVAGRWVVYRTNRTIRALDTRSRHLSVLAVARAEPVGLSVSGRRVALAERDGSLWRIRALTLPH